MTTFHIKCPLGCCFRIAGNHAGLTQLFPQLTTLGRLKVSGCQRGTVLIDKDESDASVKQHLGSILLNHATWTSNTASNLEPQPTMEQFL